MQTTKPYLKNCPICGVPYLSLQGEMTHALYHIVQKPEVIICPICEQPIGVNCNNANCNKGEMSLEAHVHNFSESKYNDHDGTFWKADR